MFKKENQRDLSPKWTLAVFTFLQLLDYIDRSVLSSMISPIKAEFNLKDGQVGDINAAFMFGYMMFSPIFAYFGDRMTRKYLIFLGVIVWSAGTWGGAFSVGILSLMAARFFVSLGEASFGAIGSSVISDKFSGTKRNNALTIFYVTIPVGYALGYILGGMLHKTVGWRETLGWVGAPGLLAAMILLPFKEPQRGALDKDEPSAVGHGSMDFGDLKNFWKIKYFQVSLSIGAAVIALLHFLGGANYFANALLSDYDFSNPALVFTGVAALSYCMFIFFIRQMIPLFGNRDYMLTCLGYCSYTAAMGAYSIWGPQFMERVHHMENAGEIFGIILLAASIPGTLFGGWLSSRLARKYSNAYALIVGASVLLGAPLVAMAFIVKSAAAVIALMAAAVFLLFANTGPVNTLIIETVPVSQRCIAMAGSIFMIHILGDLWSPSIVGRVSDATGGNLVLALMLLPTFLVIAAALWLRLAWVTRNGQAKAI